MSQAPHITVAVRVRPLTQKEAGRGAFECLEVDEAADTVICQDPDDKQVESLGGHKVTDYLRVDKTKDRSYTFDKAIGPGVSQGATFDMTTNALISDVLLGKNACCFAYGATGSGKTFTMTGSTEAPGLIPHTVDALFKAASKVGDDCTIQMQYVEIYNEQIKDLLNPEVGQALDVREAPGRGTYVSGAANVDVTSRKEVEELLLAGNENRTTESTQLNMVSSRSHAVLQLRVRFGGDRTTEGKLSLIDLAGSERASKTGVMVNQHSIKHGGTQNNNKRLNEGANINRSLLALANCISTLADMARRGGHAGSSHVPYRDSKLTRLLKDSLGGACKTMMIANVSPASDQFDESLNTLKYADRAKRIRTKAAPSPRRRDAAKRRQFSPSRSARELRDASMVARQRAAERSLADQKEGAKHAAERHLQRMQQGRKQHAVAMTAKIGRGGTLAAANGRFGGPGSDVEAATVMLQRHVRGRLAREQTMKIRLEDIRAKGPGRRRPNMSVAQRAALAQAAGDVPIAQAKGGRGLPPIQAERRRRPNLPTGHAAGAGLAAARSIPSAGAAAALSHSRGGNGVANSDSASPSFDESSAPSPLPRLNLSGRIDLKGLSL